MLLASVVGVVVVCERCSLLLWQVLWWSAIATVVGKLPVQCPQLLNI